MGEKEITVSQVQNWRAAKNQERPRLLNRNDNSSVDKRGQVSGWLVSNPGCISQRKFCWTSQYADLSGEETGSWKSRAGSN